MSACNLKETIDVVIALVSVEILWENVIFSSGGVFNPGVIFDLMKCEDGYFQIDLEWSSFRLSLPKERNWRHSHKGVPLLYYESNIDLLSYFVCVRNYTIEAGDFRWTSDHAGHVGCAFFYKAHFILHARYKLDVTCPVLAVNVSQELNTAQVLQIICCKFRFAGSMHWAYLDTSMVNGFICMCGDTSRWCVQ